MHAVSLQHPEKAIAGGVVATVPDGAHGTDERIALKKSLAGVDCALAATVPGSVSGSADISRHLTKRLLARLQD